MMVNYAWDCLFGYIMIEKQAIIDWDWYPLNRQLLLCPTSQSTTTIEEKDHEEAAGVVIPGPANMSISTEILLIPMFSQELLHPPITPSSQVQPPNFSNEFSAWFLETIVRHNDLMEVINMIKVSRDEGKSVKIQISEAKNVTAGK